MINNAEQMKSFYPKAMDTNALETLVRQAVQEPKIKDVYAMVDAFLQEGLFFMHLLKGIATTTRKGFQCIQDKADFRPEGFFFEPPAKSRMLPFFCLDGSMLLHVIPSLKFGVGVFQELCCILFQRLHKPQVLLHIALNP